MATDSGNDKSDIYVNVEADDAYRKVLVHESAAWNSTKLVVLMFVTLAIAFAALYVSTIWTGTWGRTIDYPSWLAPESTIPAYMEPGKSD